MSTSSDLAQLRHLRRRVFNRSDGVQLTLGVARQIRALGQLLTQQISGKLMGPALPGAMRIGKEELDRDPLGQALAFGHLFAPIVG